MPADVRGGKRAPTATTSKALGLNEEMMSMISEDEDLHYLLKLHHFIQKVKSSNNENTTAIEGLKL